MAVPLAAAAPDYLRNPYLLSGGVAPIPPGGSSVAPTPVADPPPGVAPGGPNPVVPLPGQTDPNPQGPSGFDQIGGTIGKALSPLSSLADIAGMVGRAAAWIADRHNWVRLLEILLGLFGLFVGLELISRELREVTKSAASGAALAAAA